jgi:hypothetical protein
VDEKLLKAVAVANEKVRRAGAAREQARRELRDAMLAARAGGHSYGAIGRALGISRQRVSEIIREHDST